MRLVRAAAILAAVLGVLLVGRAVVAAQTGDPMAPAAVTGWLLDETHVADGSTEEVDGVLQRRELQYAYRLISDDPRIAGEVLWTGSGDRFPTEPMFEVQRTTWEIVNEGGRWFGPGSAIRGQGFGETNTIELTGEGEYAGLSAYLIMDFGLGGGRSHGAIFPGEMPPQP